jgi:general secretion pathway protein A
MPFENTNDLNFFYPSSKHKEALGRMQYVVTQRKSGFLLTGECGTGKTYVINALIKMAYQHKCVTGLVSNPRLTALEFIHEVMVQLGGKPGLEKGEKMDYLRTIRERLLDNHTKKMHTVMIVDEAQSIEDPNLLEEIRLLLNFQEKESLLLSFIPVGQLQLEEMIAKRPQLAQRFALRYRLPALSGEETREYIEYRLKVAGCQKTMFTDAAQEMTYFISGGMPRVINNLCDLALLTGFIKKTTIIDKDIVTQVGQDMSGQPTE